MDIKEININLIKNYERNAKRHDKRQIKNVAESIKQFGFVQPIVIDKDGVIIIGHCRYAAALMLKMPAVPCVRVETLTKEQVNKLRLLDNKLNESEWDKALLLEDIPTLDFTGFEIDWGLDFDTEPEPGNISEAPAGTHWLVWNKHNTMPTFSDAELAWTNIDRNSVKLYDFEWNGLIGKEKECFHPTQKPVGLFADIIRDYTGNNAIVADFYGGSGTTLIACEQTGRNAYVCELSEHYCDIIIQRWENLTGKTAVKEV